MIPLISIDGGIFGILNHRATLIFMHLGFSVSMAVFMYHGFIKGSIPLSLWKKLLRLTGLQEFVLSSRSYFLC